MSQARDGDRIKSTVYWPRSLYEQMAKVAGWNRRSLNAELLTAAEEHIRRENKKRST